MLRIREEVGDTFSRFAPRIEAKVSNLLPYSSDIQQVTDLS